MKSFGKALTIAMLAVSFGVAVAPSASACPSGVLTQPAIIDSSIDTTLVQPAVMDTSFTPVIDQSITEPVVLDNGCNTCAPMVNTMLVQPAVIDNGCGLPACGTVIRERRRHLLNLDVPFFGVHLF